MLTREQRAFLVKYLTIDKKLVEAEGGRFVLEAMRSVLSRKQDQLKKTEKQAMVFDGLTINADN